MKALDAIFTSLLFIIPLIHLLVSPHTKVEESFNMQAVHDLLVYGTPTSDVAQRLAATYDHFSFPGAVPRTFLGAVLVAGVSQPVVALVGFQHAQLVARAVLGGFNAVCLAVFAAAVRRAFGVVASRWWVVLMVVGQFHVPYYLSRTLPNMFAFGLTTLASAFLIPHPANPRTSLVRQRQAIGLLVLAAAIFRSEVVILLGTTSLYLLYLTATTGSASNSSINRMLLLLQKTLIPAFLVSFATALLVSVPIDCYFWQKPLWPELWGFYFNAVQGSSSEWGVSPWHYYFTSALPRLLLNPLAPLLIVLALAQPATSRPAQALVIPPLAFVAIYSLQPHKEARFIFYAVPPLTAAAALGANFVFSRISKSILYRVASLAVVLSVLASFAASFGMLLLSSLNYPGGDALDQLYAIVRADSSPAASRAVHADILTCMTGLTLLGQNHAGLPLALDWNYAVLDSVSSAPIFLFDKTEKGRELLSPYFWQKFDYVLTEDPSKVLGDWDDVGVVHGYDGIQIMKPTARNMDDDHAERGEGDGNNASDSDNDSPQSQGPPVLGKGAVIAAIRDLVRKYTGGWWLGPRMSPRIHILKQAQRATIA